MALEILIFGLVAVLVAAAGLAMVSLACMSAAMLIQVSRWKR